MVTNLRSIFFLAALAMIAPIATAQVTPDATLNALVAKVAQEAVEQFKEQKLKDEDFAITVIDMRDPEKLISGSFRGDDRIYPASVVKLYYLAAVHQWLEDGKLTDSDELRRGMSDMIVKSNNDATNWLLECLTDAPNGALLSEDEMTTWAEKRNAVNRYFNGLGYTSLNACQKTYNEGPYGRERVFLGEKFTNRNKLTTDETARLMSEIALRKVVSPERCGQMMKLLERDREKEAAKSDSGAHSFFARAVPQGAKIWSKAGWTSTARHDVSYLELPDGRKMTIAVFTTGHANNKEILPAIAGKILAGHKPQP